MTTLREGDTVRLTGTVEWVGKPDHDGRQYVRLRVPECGEVHTFADAVEVVAHDLRPGDVVAGLNGVASGGTVKAVVSGEAWVAWPTASGIYSLDRLRRVDCTS